MEYAAWTDVMRSSHHSEALAVNRTDTLAFSVCRRSLSESLTHLSHHQEDITWSQPCEYKHDNRRSWVQSPTQRLTSFAQAVHCPVRICCCDFLCSLPIYLLSNLFALSPPFSASQMSSAASESESSPSPSLSPSPPALG